jgi:hypothetical protein
VTDAEREQIRLTLVDLLDRADTELSKAVMAVFARHSARGLLRSGMTIQAGAKEVEQRLIAFVTDAVDRVKAVSISTGSFDMISDAVERFIASTEPQSEKIIRMGESRPAGTGVSAAGRAALGLFAEGKNRARRQLELHRFAFSRESHSGSITAGTAAPISSSVPQKGGRPPADFWDDLWSHIAASLYAGDLMPKNQADIEKAMADWIEGQGRSAATSTIRSRARRLWDQLTQLDP